MPEEIAMERLYHRFAVVYLTTKNWCIIGDEIQKGALPDQFVDEMTACEKKSNRQIVCKRPFALYFLAKKNGHAFGLPPACPL